jgi:hypothetical protein
MTTTMPGEDTSPPKIRITLDSVDQYVAFNWSLGQLWNYLENLQDDQKCCYECGANDFQHINGDGSFDSEECEKQHLEIIHDHPYNGECPNFDVVTMSQMETPDGVLSPPGMWAEIALEPAMVFSFLVNNIFYPGGDFDGAENDDFHEYGSAPKEPELARTIWLKLHKAVEQYDDRNQEEA